MISALRILIVDDDSVVRDIICSQVLAGGHYPEPAENGLSALVKFEVDLFDLVITDRVMPGMSGYQLAIAIKKINPLMPILLLTGLGDMEDVASSEEVDLVVCKPFTFSTLMGAIEKISKR